MSETLCYVVMYHYVRDTEKTAYPDIKGLSIAEFEQQLDWLCTQYEIIGYSQFEALRHEHKPGERPYALLTFDDGFIDHYANVYPILKRRGLSGVFFITSSTIGDAPTLLNVHKTHFLLAKLGAEWFNGAVLERLQSQTSPILGDVQAREGIYRYDHSPDYNIKKLLNYELPFPLVDAILDDLFTTTIGDSTAFARELYLSEQMIREMAADGMIFGGHTKTHRVLSRLSAGDQLEELAAGYMLVQRLTQQSQIPFCYPYGHPHTYDQSTLKGLATVGYSSAFNTLRAAVKSGQDDRYELPRFDTKDLPPFTPMSS